MLQRMLASSDTHFSESAMRERNPLLYQQLVGCGKYFGIFNLPSFSKLIYSIGKKMVVRSTWDFSQVGKFMTAEEKAADEAVEMTNFFELIIFQGGHDQLQPLQDHPGAHGHQQGEGRQEEGGEGGAGGGV